MPKHKEPDADDRGGKRDYDNDDMAGRTRTPAPNHKTHDEATRTPPRHHGSHDAPMKSPPNRGGRGC